MRERQVKRMSAELQTVVGVKRSHNQVNLFVYTAVNGAWSSWGEWSACSISCGGGEQARERECGSPAPSKGGDECKGEGRETELCNTDKCPQVVEIPVECGQTKVGSNRIVNGKPAKRNAWPWLAALGYTDPNSGDVLYLCGATLVTARHVVTAAHCIRDDMVTVLLGVRITRSRWIDF